MNFSFILQAVIHVVVLKTIIFLISYNDSVLQPLCEQWYFIISVILINLDFITLKNKLNEDYVHLSLSLYLYSTYIMG